MRLSLNINVILFFVGITLITSAGYSALTTHYQIKDEITIRLVVDDDVNPDQGEIVEYSLFNDNQRVRMNGKSYYTNWNVVFDDYNIEKQFVLTNEAVSDVVITLVDEKGAKVESLGDDAFVAGNTRSYPVFGNLVYSEITIYDSNNLTPERLRDFVNHELGHAIGLQHQDCDCLMSPVDKGVPITDGDVIQLLRHYGR